MESEVREGFGRKMWLGLGKGGCFWGRERVVEGLDVRSEDGVKCFFGQVSAFWREWASDRMYIYGCI